MWISPLEAMDRELASSGDELPRCGSIPRCGTLRRVTLAVTAQAAGSGGNHPRKGDDALEPLEQDLV